MSELNLIWQTTEGEQTSFELEYISQLLFKDIPHIKHFDNKKYSLVLNNAIIIYSNNHRGPSFDFINYLNKFKKIISNFICGTYQMNPCYTIAIITTLHPMFFAIIITLI